MADPTIPIPDRDSAPYWAALADGWTCFKTKVGLDVAGDVRRCEVMREEIGDLPLMADANQVWDVDEAIARTFMPTGVAAMCLTLSWVPTV